MVYDLSFTQEQVLIPRDVRCQFTCYVLPCYGLRVTDYVLHSTIYHPLTEYLAAC